LGAAHLEVVGLPTFPPASHFANSYHHKISCPSNFGPHDSSVA
jgi:hypothetical protein